MSNPLSFVDEEGNIAINLLQYRIDHIVAGMVWWPNGIFGYHIKSNKIQGEFRGQIQNIEGLLLYSKHQHKLNFNNWRLHEKFDKICDLGISEIDTKRYKEIIEHILLGR